MNLPGLFEEYKGYIVFALFILNITLIYKIIQLYSTSYYMFTTSFEDMIPFISFFALPYITYLIVMFLPFILAWKDRKMFLAVSSAFLFAALVCNVIFIIFPTAIARPEVIGNSIFDMIVAFIYHIDGITNCFPSEHVTFSVLACLCLLHINKRWAYVSIALTLVIIPSTLLIKQHYIPDLVGGMILALTAYLLVFRGIVMQKDNHKKPNAKKTKKRQKGN